MADLVVNSNNTSQQGRELVSCIINLKLDDINLCDTNLHNTNLYDINLHDINFHISKLPKLVYC